MRLRRVRLDRILLPVSVPAGMSPLVVMSLAYLYRASNEDVEPVELTRHGRFYRVTDGRHRVVASHIAGRRRVLAVVT